MAPEPPPGESDVLAGWLGRRTPRTRGAAGNVSVVSTGLRFALYGRMSTEGFQHRASSCGWQRMVAEELIAGHGVIVAEYFDGTVSTPSALTSVETRTDP